MGVHMVGNTVNFFEIAQIGTNAMFDIQQIMRYDEKKNRVLLKVKAAKADKRFYNRFTQWATFNTPENRWLYLGNNTDSKRFLLFLLEMYSEKIRGTPYPRIFTPAAEGAIRAIFNDSQGKQIVSEHIGDRYPQYGLVNPANAAKFKVMCGLQEEPHRRRLVEAAYYSFIGFNMLLMCCLLVGISFAYHVGTHEVNHEPIRW